MTGVVHLLSCSNNNWPTAERQHIWKHEDGIWWNGWKIEGATRLPLALVRRSCNLIQCYNASLCNVYQLVFQAECLMKWTWSNPQPCSVAQSSLTMSYVVGDAKSRTTVGGPRMLFPMLGDREALRFILFSNRGNPVGPMFPVSWKDLPCGKPT